MSNIKQSTPTDLWKEALTSFQSNQLAQAESICRHLLNHFPAYTEAHYLLGLIYGKNQNYPTAIACFKNAIKLKSTIPEFHFELAHTLRVSGFMNESIIHFQHVTQLLPQSANAFLDLGSAYHATGELNQVIQAYQKSIHLKPDFGMAYYNLGLAYQNIEQIEQALESFKQALNFITQSDIFFK